MNKQNYKNVVNIYHYQCGWAPLLLQCSPVSLAAGSCSSGHWYQNQALAHSVDLPKQNNTLLKNYWETVWKLTDLFHHGTELLVHPRFIKYNFLIHLLQQHEHFWNIRQSFLVYLTALHQLHEIYNISLCNS